MPYTARKDHADELRDLCAKQGLTPSKVAALVGRSEEAVKSWLSKAPKKHRPAPGWAIELLRLKLQLKTGNKRR